MAFTVSKYEGTEISSIDALFARVLKKIFRDTQLKIFPNEDAKMQKYDIAGNLYNAPFRLLMCSSTFEQ